MIFLRSVNCIALTVGVVCCATIVHSCVSAEVKSSPDVVIYSGSYPGWPTITRTPGGKLVCVWREGIRHEYTSTGKVMLGESVDGGQTWTNIRTVQDEDLIDDRNTSILALSEDHWLLAYDAHTGSIHQAKTTYTTDGGNTWSTPVVVNDSCTNATRGAPVQLSNGNLLLPYFYAGQGSWQSLSALSSDGGQTWTTYEVPNTPECIGTEWSVAEMPDHSLMGIIRNQAASSDGSLYVTKSTDWGQSWSAPQKTNLRDVSGGEWFSPAQIFLHEGEPWVVYDDERYVSVSLATTDDPDLINWNVDERIQAYQYMPDGSRIYDGGYPSSVYVGGGQQLIVDYYINGGTRQIVGYYATLPTPEPSALALLGFAMIWLLAYAWRKRK